MYNRSSSAFNPKFLLFPILSKKVIFLPKTIWLGLKSSFHYTSFPSHMKLLYIYIIYFCMNIVPFYRVKKWLLFHCDHKIINECRCICMPSYVTRCVWVKGNVKIWKWIIYTSIIKCCLSIDLLTSECVMLLCTYMNAWITFWNILWNTHCFVI